MWIIGILIIIICVGYVIYECYSNIPTIKFTFNFDHTKFIGKGAKYPSPKENVSKKQRR